MLGCGLLPMPFRQFGNVGETGHLTGNSVDSRATLTAYLTQQRQRITSSVEGWLGVTPKVTTQKDSNPSAAPPNNSIIGRLTIPRLKLHSIVREGTGEDTLSLAVGHLRGTAIPGESGNVALQRTIATHCSAPSPLFVRTT